MRGYIFLTYKKKTISSSQENVYCEEEKVCLKSQCQENDSDTRTMTEIEELNSKNILQTITCVIRIYIHS